MSSNSIVDLTGEESKKAKPVLVLAIAQYTMIAHSKLIMQFAGPTRLRSVCSQMVRNADVTIVKLFDQCASARKFKAVLKARPNVHSVDIRPISMLNAVIAFSWILPFRNRIDELLIRNGFNLLIQTSANGPMFYNEVLPNPSLNACEVLMTCMVAYIVADYQHAELFALNERTFQECNESTMALNMSPHFTVIQDTDEDFTVCIHELINCIYGVVPAVNRFQRWYLHKHNGQWMVRKTHFFFYGVHSNCSVCVF